MILVDGDLVVDRAEGIDPAVIAQLEAERDDIVAAIQRIDAQFTRRKAELDELRNACHAMGPSGRRVYFEAEAEYEAWKKRAVSAKRHRVRELQDIKARIKAVNMATTTSTSTRRYLNLRRAVHEHRRWVMDNGYEPTAADLELWAILHDNARLDDPTHG